MNKLVQTNLQKIILFIGGLLIFLRLLDVSYYDRYNAILTSIGILVLIIVLLVVLQDYHPKFHLKVIAFLKKHRRFLIYSLFFIFLIILIRIGYVVYSEIKEENIKKAQEEEFHKAEVSYQKCLDKIAVLTIWKTEPVNKSDGYIHLYDTIITGQNKYFDEWRDAGSPNYNQDKGHWEWAFMEWMMEKYPEFCEEYNTDLINYFLDEKEVMILGLPELSKTKIRIPSSLLP